MKAGLFDPYLDTLGGGERYCLTLAEYLSKKGWTVDAFWDDPALKEKLSSRFALDLKRVNFVSIPENLLKKWQTQRNYNLFFHLSDGSIPFLFARKNILHFQVPFHDVGGKSILNQLKLKKIHHIVCNSAFTKKIIDEEYGVCSKIIFPPVDIQSFKLGKKENIILSVGRFSQLLQAKRQDVLVEVFKKMVDGGLAGWRLILAGGADVGVSEYLEKLKEQAQDYPITILENLKFSKVQELYGKAKIFWSASGFGIDEEKEPEKVEHFGITTIEAMAAGCVPVVIGKGGPKEIIELGKSGFIWQKKSELVKITQELISEPGLLKRIAQNVVKSTQKFSKIRFCQEFDEIIS